MDSLLLVALIIVQFLFIIALELMHRNERIRLEDIMAEEREALLNRLMARDLTEYVQADLASKYQPPQQPVMHDGIDDDFNVGM